MTDWPTERLRANRPGQLSRVKDKDRRVGGKNASVLITIKVQPEGDLSNHTTRPQLHPSSRNLDQLRMLPFFISLSYQETGQSSVDVDRFFRKQQTHPLQTIFASVVGRLLCTTKRLEVCKLIPIRSYTAAAHRVACTPAHPSLSAPGQYQVNVAATFPKCPAPNAQMLRDICNVLMWSFRYVYVYGRCG